MCWFYEQKHTIKGHWQNYLPSTSLIDITDITNCKDRSYGPGATLTDISKMSKMSIDNVGKKVVAGKLNLELNLKCQ